MGKKTEYSGPKRSNIQTPPGKPGNKTILPKPLVMRRGNLGPLYSLFQSFPDPLILIDDALHVKMLNPAAARYCHLVQNESVIGQFCHQIFTENPSPCKNCIVPAAVAARQHVSFERRGCMEPDKLERVIVYPFMETDSQSGGAMIRIQDISREKLLERQMIEREKLASLGFMLSSISHELASPANAISLNVPILGEYVEALMAIVEDLAENRRDLEIFNQPYDQFIKDVHRILANVTHGSARIQTKVSELKNFGRRKKQPGKTWVDVRQLARRVAALIRIEIDQRVKSFEMQLPDTLPKIHVNSDEIEQILINLLINAAHAADKEASRVRLEIKTGSSWQEHIVIEVSDNGCGMDKAVIQDIFKPFFSANDSGTGSGLGLYICKVIVENLQGHIKVDSRPGEGSVFTVVLPDLERRSMKRL